MLITRVEDGPGLIVAGTAYSRVLRIINDQTGAAVSMTACTYSLHDEEGTAVYTDEVCDVDPDTTAVFTAGSDPGLDIGKMYVETWAPEITDPIPVHRAEVYVVKALPSCPILSSDLRRLHPELPGTSTSVLTDLVEATWWQVVGDLLASGMSRKTIQTPNRLVGWVKYETLAAAMRMMTRVPGDRFSDLALTYQGMARDERALIMGGRLEVDEDNDGTTDISAARLDVSASFPAGPSRVR